MKQPVVAIVGRPNVGKSTILNRLAGKRLALVNDEPGVTRDRIYHSIEHKGFRFTLVDTGGLDLAPSDDPLRTLVEEQSRKAVEEADLILLVVEGTHGPTLGDWRLAEELRSSNKPVLVVVNKLDSVDDFHLAYDFYQLGLGEPIPVSGLYGLNVGYLCDKLVDCLKQNQGEEEGGIAREEAVKVALIGRPNVGKSSLFNRLVGEERAIVSDLPGTTRDAIDTLVRVNDKTYRFVDTAGIRRKTRVRPGLEQYSSMRSFTSIKRSDVVVMVADAQEGITSQDNRLINYIAQRAGKGIVLAANKCDLLDPQVVKTFPPSLLRFIPIILTSARTGFGIASILKNVDMVYSQWRKSIPTPALNSVLREAVSRKALPLYRGKKVRLLYASQVGTSPPRFLFFANYPQGIPLAYRRYLENQLRKEFGFIGSPIWFEFRAQS
ncbi:MAG: ribosome biogenesis GTPase Der [Clostridia bacterium]|nr:ribosome biogenesis GTPase Der [Clostridia bacterium]